MNELDDKFEDLSGDIQFGGCSHLYPSQDFQVMEWAAWTMVFIPLISIIINCICIKKQAKEQEGDDKSSPAQKPVRLSYCFRAKILKSFLGKPCFFSRNRRNSVHDRWNSLPHLLL